MIRCFDTAYVIAIMLGFYSELSAILEIVLPSTVRLINSHVHLSIPADYRRTLHFIVRSFDVNELFNVFTSNWKLDFTASDCSCTTSFDCTEPLIEGLVTGCFPFDGLRQSTFDNRPLGELNDRLFVSAWHNRSNYIAYFEVCRPLECRYAYIDRSNPMYMFTTVVGVYEGERHRESKRREQHGVMFRLCSAFFGWWLIDRCVFTVGGRSKTKNSRWKAQPPIH